MKLSADVCNGGFWDLRCFGLLEKYFLFTGRTLSQIVGAATSHTNNSIDCDDSVPTYVVGIWGSSKPTPLAQDFNAYLF